MTAKRMILLPERHSLIQINCFLTKQDLIESEKTRVVAISGATFGSALAMYQYDDPWKPQRRTPSACNLHGMEIRERAVAAMKAVSKHATCGKVGNSRSHRREIERLVQWRQRHVTLELMQRLGIEAHRAVELVATIPPDQAFCPLERSRCSLVGKQQSGLIQALTQQEPMGLVDLHALNCVMQKCRTDQIRRASRAELSDEQGAMAFELSLGRTVGHLTCWSSRR